MSKIAIDVLYEHFVDYCFQYNNGPRGFIHYAETTLSRNGIGPTMNAYIEYLSYAHFRWATRD